MLSKWLHNEVILMACLTPPLITGKKKERCSNITLSAQSDNERGYPMNALTIISIAMRMVKRERVKVPAMTSTDLGILLAAVAMLKIEVKQ